MPTKPKRTQPITPNETQERDYFQTPAYGTDLIAPFLHGLTIWEPAAGQGRMVKRLQQHGLCVHATSLETGQNFQDYQPPFTYDATVTNIPFSLKELFI